MIRLLVILSRAVCPLALLVFATACTTPAVSPEALTYARSRVAEEVGTSPKKGSLIIVDYSKPSSAKRLTVVNLRNGHGKMNSRVAHGVNSGLLYATDFSNVVGSQKSSLGLYELAEEFNGKHGASFRLDGLDPGLNTNARKRGIIVHSADYATRDAMRANRREYGRLGRSAGCLALSERDLARLDRKITRPVYLYAYAPELARQTQPPADTAPPSPAPQPMLASASAPVPAEKSAVARPPQAPQPALLDRPAIARPATADSGRPVKVF